MKTVNISGRVAKLAWDKTVGGTQCVQSLQTGSQLGPNLVVNGLAEKHADVSRSTSHHCGRRVLVLSGGLTDLGLAFG